MSGMARRRSTAAPGGDGAAPGPGARRRHGAARPGDRGELERAGWRTTLEYRENHVRGPDGRLRRLEVQWRAEAEREVSDGGGEPIVIWACGSTVDKVWSRLRMQADIADRPRDPRELATATAAR